ncbi:MAG: arginine deiminase family protein [Metamycoplasmataceae bacterium]
MIKSINTYSEIGNLRKVLVHTPGKEIEYISPERLDELLFSALLEPKQAREEHKSFIKILEKEGVEVVQLIDLISETYDICSQEAKNNFIETWLDEVEPKIINNSVREKIKNYVLGQKTTKELVSLLMSGIMAKELGIEYEHELVVDPMPNLYFTRDPFASVGNGVTVHKMKYKTRRRETIFSDFIFKNHPEYKDVYQYSSRNDEHTIEGGDVFIYNSKTLVIGVSERTEMEEIELIANKLKDRKDNLFETVIAINVPKKKNLMHLDTWLTMLDFDKFLYSPNMMGTLRIWKIKIKGNDHSLVELNVSLEEILEEIIGKKPILIPVAGEGASHLSIDLETHFDATNYLVIRPGVVVGYSRNEKTEEALKAHGIKVLSFVGNQLSLGMGSTRCMSMPLIRDKVEK